MIATNNPGNLRHTGQKWLGELAPLKGFCVFDTMEHGIRATAKTLVTYQEQHGLYSIAEMIMRWAPHSENDTVAYIDDVAARVGIAPDEYFTVLAPEPMTRMIKAIIWHENGQQPVAEATIAAGVAAAMPRKVSP